MQGIEEGCFDDEGNSDVTKWSKMATFTTLEGYVRPIDTYTSNQNGWNLIASPIGTVSIEDVINLCSNDYDLYYFDQTGGDNGLEWKNYEAVDGTTSQPLHPNFTSLESGKGYLYANNQDVTLEFLGEPYNDNGTVNLVYSTANQNANMRLLYWLG